jgi:cell division protein FtsI/penicillin-binding protein 2
MEQSKNTKITFPSGNHAPNSRLRARIIQILLLALFAGIILRLIYVQIIDSERLADLVKRQREAKRILEAERGIIFDRTGFPLATSIQRASFAVDPTKAKDSAKAIAKTFSRLFGKSRNYYLNIINTKDSQFEWLVKFVDIKYKKIIQSKDYNAIISRSIPQRLYFYEYLAGQLLGTTRSCDTALMGLAGIESYFEEDLSGQDGYEILQRNGLRELTPTVDYPRVEPENGHNIYLTIDRVVQQIAEKELKLGAERTKARGGIAIVMVPKTGEILAIAQYPQINPEKYGKFEPEDQRLRAVTDIFEPGSVFKIVTAAAALENHLVSPAKIFDAGNGKYEIYKNGKKIRTIIDHEKKPAYSFEDAVTHSSNVVMVKISDIIGQNKFYRMARDFGFGNKTKVEFPGEDMGILKKPKDWSGMTLNSMAFGYEISATPLQIACAYAAIANNGVLMKPTLIKKITDAEGTILCEPDPEKIRTVISPSTVKTLTGMLERVVQIGTGTNAKIDGWRIAGKTGTAKKNMNGVYSTEKYIASFAGFFPADNPQVVCLVMIDEPAGSEIYASTVSAPIFRAIAEQIINLTDYVESSNRPLIASNQNTKAFPLASEMSTVKTGVVPDVVGLSKRRAFEILREHKLLPSATGSGIVIDQEPDAGSPAKNNLIIRLVCQSTSTPSIGYRSQ